MATVQVVNARQIVVALEQHGADMEAGVQAELDVLAQIATSKMRQRAPKWRTKLTNSIRTYKPDAMTREIRPGEDYAEAMEFGVKPGGKGLPRFFDPASADIVAWLQSKAFAGQRRPKQGSRLMQAAELALRDRYAGLAWHVRRHGVKARPFVEPTRREMEPIVLARMDLAVRRVLAARPDAGSAAA